MDIDQRKQPLLATYLRNLTLWVFIAIVAGVVFGYFVPTISLSFNQFSALFFKLLSLLIMPVIFLAMMYGICGLHFIPKAWLLVLHTAIYFIIITSFCILLGFSFAYLIEPGKSNSFDLIAINTENSGSPSLNAHLSFITLIKPNKQGVFLSIGLAASIIVNFLDRKQYVYGCLEQALALFYKLIKYVYMVLPVFIFCNTAYSVAVYGLDALLPLSKVMATVYICCFVFVFGILGFIAPCFKLNLWTFLRSLKEEILLVLVTSSSKTAFPTIFEKLEKQGYPAALIRFVIPIGYCFNLAGACIYLSICCVFFIQLYAVEMNFWDYIGLFVVISFTSKTASGVPGSGFLALVFTLSNYARIPMTEVGLLYSIDRFMNEARAVTNFIGIAVSAAVLAKIYQKKSIFSRENHQTNTVANPSIYRRKR